MKISKIIYKLFCFSIGFALSGSFLSCGSTKVEAPPIEEPAPIIEEPIVEEPIIEIEEPPAPVIEEVEPQPPVEEVPIVEPSEEDDEYSRSVGDIDVSRDTFIDDKDKILRIIEKLSVVMKDMDYKAWLTYVDDESIQYWQKNSNLKKAQNRLPVKGLKLKNLQDYFKYVFVPARAGRTVTEIRYISDTYIKAIQVQKEQDIVYYYFNKINGQWKIHLPPIES